MILDELTPVPAEALPIVEFREHLLLGTGFSDDAAQDSVLEAQLRAALSAIEARTQKALFARPFRWRLTAWRGFQREELPVAPVSQITSVKIFDGDGAETVIPPSAYILEADAQHPAVAAKGFGLPLVPVAGTVEIGLVAGYAADWTGIPPALRQAVLILAANFYEHRNADGTNAVLPTRVMQLIAPFRVVRLFGRRG